MPCPKVLYITCLVEYPSCKRFMSGMWSLGFIEQSSAFNLDKQTGPVVNEALMCYKAYADL